MHKTILPWLTLLAASVSAFSLEISDPNGLRSINNNCEGNYTLKGPINMDGESFSPLCQGGFTGEFDGNGYSISNLSIEANLLQVPNVAFVAVLGTGGVIKNVTFEKATIKASVANNGSSANGSVAVVVGKLEGGSIEHVHVTGDSVTVKGKNKSSADAGGLAGTAESGEISESDCDVTIETSNLSKTNVGGICGSVTGDVTLTSVSYTGNSPVEIAGSGMDVVTIATKYGALTVNEKNSVKTAFIDGAYASSGAVEIPADIVVSGVTMDRTFNAGKIATLYVPFEIPAADVVGANVYKFKTVVKSEEDGRWKFKVSTAETVKPNTPYVLLPTSSEVSFDIAESVTLNTKTQGEETSNGQWEFVGTYSYTNFVLDNNNPVYLFADQERDGAKLGEFVKIGTGAFTNPMRAYLVYHKTLAKSARGNLGSNILLPDELDIEVENENGVVVQTGKLNTVTGEVRMDRWFDLKGRKLNSKPTAKGTYYKNGKKAIIK